MKGKRDDKKRVIFIFVILLMIPLVSAGFSDIINKITGKATSDTVSVNITIGNSAPTINFVESISAQSITEASTTAVGFSFIAADVDGVANLDDGTAQASFNRTGETTRSTTCTASDLNLTAVNYSCSIDMWYFDGAGTWTINVSVDDILGLNVEDTTNTFTLSQTTAMVLGPTALGWSSLSPTSVDQLSNTDPVTLNNTGNKAISDGSLSITAIDLQGETTTTEFLLAANFTSHITDACDVGTQLVNSTSTAVSGATLPNGNFSDGTAQEDLYFCLEAVTAGISQQSYSTAGGSSGPWTVSVV